MEKKLNKLITNVAGRVLVPYLLTLALYYYIKPTFWRCILSIGLFSILVIIYNIPFNQALFILFIALCAAFTEHIFIKYMSHTWDYRKPNIINIPYWLPLLWAIVIVLIIEMCYSFNSIYTPF